MLEAQSMEKTLREIALACKGYLDEEEGLRLYQLAREAAQVGPVLEVGSYCGKSSVYLGAGVREVGGTLFCLDHHRGSEEHQPGEEYHDNELFDPVTGCMETLPALRRTLHAAGLERSCVLLVSRSQDLAPLWQTPLSMVFIDGGHSETQAQADYDGWSDKIMPGGLLAIHDLFPNPAEGGQAPINIYRKGLHSGRFEALPTTKTLGVLRCIC